MAAGGGSLFFRQLCDVNTGTFTYLLADVPSGKGVLIDSVFERHARDLALILELGIHLVASIDTHLHADHVTGSWLMHQATGGAIGLAAAAQASHVTLPLQHGDQLAFGRRHLEVRATPGHTNGCLSFVIDDHTMAFTGDALLVRGCGCCDFQQSDAPTLWRSITGQIPSLPEWCLLYPGHDYTGRSVTSVAEERAFNPRLGGTANQRDFVGHMENMKLPHPRHIAEALPGNLRSGKPSEGQAADGHGAQGWKPGRLRSQPIARLSCFAIAVVARPWPPNSCSRPACSTSPTSVVASAAGLPRGTPLRQATPRTEPRYPHSSCTPAPIHCPLSPAPPCDGRPRPPHPPTPGRTASKRPGNACGCA